MVDRVVAMAAPAGSVMEALEAMDTALTAPLERVDQGDEELLEVLGVRRAS